MQITQPTRPLNLFERMTPGEEGELAARGENYEREIGQMLTKIEASIKRIKVVQWGDVADLANLAEGLTGIAAVVTGDDYHPKDNGIGYSKSIEQGNTRHRARIAEAIKTIRHGIKGKGTVDPYWLADIQRWIREFMQDKF